MVFLFFISSSTMSFKHCRVVALVFKYHRMVMCILSNHLGWLVALVPVSSTFNTVLWLLLEATGINLHQGTH